MKIKKQMTEFYNVKNRSNSCMNKIILNESILIESNFNKQRQV